MTKILKDLTSLSRERKKLIVSLVDFLSIITSIILAFLASGLSLKDLNISQSLSLISIPFITILIFNILGIYRSVLRYIDFSVIYLLFRGLLVALALNLIIHFAFYYSIMSLSQEDHLTEEIVSFLGWSVGILSAVVLVTGTRLFANYIFRNKYAQKKVVIYGAGSAGIQLASALKVSTEMQPIAFVDRNSSLHNTFLGELKVLSPQKLPKLIQRGKVDEVLIAIPSASKAILRSLLNEVEKYSVKVRILPGLAEIAQGKVLVSELKEVDTSDLLGRYEVEANQELINMNIRDKVVLITGAGGSIGSEISRQVARNGVKKIIIFDSNEFALYAIKGEIESSLPEVDLYAVLGNVCNKDRVFNVCSTFKVNTIYHAAAYKHVPLVEENTFEGINNNIFGTLACLEAAMESNVETFVLISTDKAVRPTNIMGASKRFSEMILQSFSSDIGITHNTRMTMVRFGNVLGSSGSAIPLFQKQIKEGGPVTVTHPEVIRYFMSIPEASELVIQAGALGKGGDVFVLDMGEPVRIYELAKKLIGLSGMEIIDEENLNGDIEIIFTGLRPGEKLYEELLIGDNVSATSHKQILRAEENSLDKDEINKYLSSFKEVEKNNDVQELKNILQSAITEFTPDKEIVDVIYSQKNN